MPSSEDLGKQKKVRQGTITFFSGSVLCSILAYAFLNYVYFQLPPALPASTTPKSVFSGERAFKHAEYLVNKIGERWAGTKANDIDAVNFLLDEINQITTIEDGPIIEVSVQKTSGSFHMKWLHAPLTSAFSNLTNVVVRIRPRNRNMTSTKESLKFMPNDSTERNQYNHYLEYIATSQKDDHIRSNINKGYQEKHEQYVKEGRDAIMLSAHFDTAMQCRGASDDTVHIGVLLELLQMYANNKVNQAPLLLVFNGGEEPGMQAAYGLVAQHPWVKDARLVVNLEASGSATGREMLFQTAPGNAWLVNAYSKSNHHAHASISAQDLFMKLKVVPGDTDFIVYRDLGDLPGVDLAFTEKGYFYHTRYDDMDHVSPSALQNTGNTLTSYITELSVNYLQNPEVMKNLNVYEESIFFTVLGYMFDVTRDDALKMFVAITAIVLAAFLLDANYAKPQTPFIKYTIKNIIWTALSWLAANICTALFALFLSLVLEKRMVWFSNIPFAVALYSIPCIIGILLVQWITQDDSIDEDDAFNGTFWSTAFFTIFFMFTFYYMELGTSCIFFFGLCNGILLKTVVYPVVHFVTSIILPLNYQKPIGRAICVIISAFAYGIPDGMMLRTVVEFYVPISGRSGTQVEADLALSLILAFPLLRIILPYMLPFFRYFVVYKKAIIAWIIALASMIVYIYTSDIKPYHKGAPKRVVLQNSVLLDEEGNIAKSYILGFSVDSIHLSEVSAITNYSKVHRFSNAIFEFEQFYPFALHISDGMVQLEKHNYSYPIGKRPRPPILPYVKMVKDEFKQIGNTHYRTIYLETDSINEGHITGLRIPSKHMTKWSFTSELPPESPPGSFNVRRLGQGTLSFWVELASTNKNDLTLDLQANFQYLNEKNQVLDELWSLIPEDITANVLLTYIRTYKF